MKLIDTLYKVAGKKTWTVYKAEPKDERLKILCEI